MKKDDVVVGQYSGLHYRVQKYDPRPSRQFPHGSFLVIVAGDKHPIHVAIDHVEPLATTVA